MYSFKKYEDENDRHKGRRLNALRDALRKFKNDSDILGAFDYYTHLNEGNEFYCWVDMLYNYKKKELGKFKAILYVYNKIKW